jgi:hypothetical protein
MNYLLFPEIVQVNLPKKFLGYQLGAGSQFMMGSIFNKGWDLGASP